MDIPTMSVFLASYKTLLILLVSVLTCASQILQKYTAISSSANQRWLLLFSSLALLGFAMLLWLLVLRAMPVSIAYPLLSINYLFMALIARRFWGEKLSAQQWQGLALIILGIACVGLNA